MKGTLQRSADDRKLRAAPSCGYGLSSWAEAVKGAVVTAEIKESPVGWKKEPDVFMKNGEKPPFIIGLFRTAYHSDHDPEYYTV